MQETAKDGTAAQGMKKGRVIYSEEIEIMATQWCAVSRAEGCGTINSNFERKFETLRPGWHDEPLLLNTVYWLRRFGNT
jgi:hypothetical protein